MALKLNYVKNVAGVSVTYPDTYIRIEKMSGNKHNIDMLVNLYNNANNISSPECLLIEQRTFNMPFDCEKLVMQQGYDYLKKLPEFSGSIDC